MGLASTDHFLHFDGRRRTRGQRNRSADPVLCLRTGLRLLFARAHRCDRRWSGVREQRKHEHHPSYCLKRDLLRHGLPAPRAHRHSPPQPQTGITRGAKQEQRRTDIDRRQRKNHVVLEGLGRESRRTGIALPHLSLGRFFGSGGVSLRDTRADLDSCFRGKQFQPAVRGFPVVVLHTRVCPHTVLCLEKRNLFDANFFWSMSNDFFVFYHYFHFYLACLDNQSMVDQHFLS